MNKEKTIKIIICILAALTVINIAAIIFVEARINAPLTNTKVEVFGAVFNQETEENVIDVNLVRLPRVSVNPGEVVEEDFTLINTSDLPLYFRCAYDIIVEDENYNIVDNFKENVMVTFNDDWEYCDGYWYYKEPVSSYEKISGLFNSVEYSENFAEHRDYSVYIPVIIESVEVKKADIENVDYWPENDIAEIDYKRLNNSASWNTNTNIDLI